MQGLARPPIDFAIVGAILRFDWRGKVQVTFDTYVDVGEAAG